MTTIISDIKWKQALKEIGIDLDEDYDDDEFDEEEEERKEYSETDYPHFYGPMDAALKYTLRVTLKDSPIPILRKFEVPSNITLRHLSELIIKLMGWDNYHLNQIFVGNHFFLPYYQMDETCSQDYIQEEYTLDDILTIKGRKIYLTYDFGDNWDHQILLSSIKEYTPEEPRVIKFIKGTGECPPEDCGGVWGYGNLLEILNKWKSGKRLSADEKDQMEWAFWDKHYDPSGINVEQCEEICADFSK